MPICTCFEGYSLYAKTRCQRKSLKFIYSKIWCLVILIPMWVPSWCLVTVLMFMFTLLLLWSLLKLLNILLLLLHKSFCWIVRNLNSLARWSNYRKWHYCRPCRQFYSQCQCQLSLSLLLPLPLSLPPPSVALLYLLSLLSIEPFVIFIVIAVVNVCDVLVNGNVTDKNFIVFFCYFHSHYHCHCYAVAFTVNVVATVNVINNVTKALTDTVIFVVVIVFKWNLVVIVVVIIVIFCNYILTSDVLRYNHFHYIYMSRIWYGHTMCVLNEHVGSPSESTDCFSLKP